jgi:hypothetical protein
MPEISTGDFVSCLATEWGQGTAQELFGTAWKAARVVGKVVSINFRRKRNVPYPTYYKVRFYERNGTTSEYLLRANRVTFQSPAATEPPEFQNPQYADQVAEDEEEEESDGDDESDDVEVPGTNQQDSTSVELGT